jgi:ferredoxin-type protein NapG
MHAPRRPRWRGRLPGRRRLIGSALAAGLLGTVAFVRARSQARLPPDERTLRPPGALAERAFDAACVRCGLCVQSCPFDVLRLAGADGPVAAGTPYFRARDKACVMCADLPCQRACPTGALGPRTLRIVDARMGVAALAAPERCYSFIGAAACNSCWKACPLRAQGALVMRRGVTMRGGRFTPTVDAAVCTGCGLCEQACIAEQPAIRVAALRDGATRRPAG